jgi:GGDEF domain-containing protein
VDVIARPSPSEIVVILNDMAKPQARQLSESIAALFAGDQDFAGWDIQCRSETLEFD